MYVTLTTTRERRSSSANRDLYKVKFFFDNYKRSRKVFFIETPKNLLFRKYMAENVYLQNRRQFWLYFICEKLNVAENISFNSYMFPSVKAYFRLQSFCFSLTSICVSNGSRSMPSEMDFEKFRFESFFCEHLRNQMKIQ